MVWNCNKENSAILPDTSTSPNSSYESPNDSHMSHDCDGEDTTIRGELRLTRSSRTRHGNMETGISPTSARIRGQEQDADIHSSTVTDSYRHLRRPQEEQQEGYEDEPSKNQSIITEQERSLQWHQSMLEKYRDTVRSKNIKIRSLENELILNKRLLANSSKSPHETQESVALDRTEDYENYNHNNFSSVLNLSSSSSVHSTHTLDKESYDKDWLMAPRSGMSSHSPPVVGTNSSSVYEEQQRLSAQIHDLEKQITDYQTMCHSNALEMKSLQRIIVALTNENLSYRKKETDHLLKQADLQRQLILLQEQDKGQTGHQEQLHDLELQLALKDDVISQYQKDIQQAIEVEKENQMKIADLSDEIIQMEKEKETLQAELESLTNMLEKSRAVAANTVGQLIVKEETIKSLMLSDHRDEATADCSESAERRNSNQIHALTIVSHMDQPLSPPSEDDIHLWKVKLQKSNEQQQLLVDTLYQLRRNAESRQGTIAENSSTSHDHSTCTLQDTEFRILEQLSEAQQETITRLQEEIKSLRDAQDSESRIKTSSENSIKTLTDSIDVLRQENKMLASDITSLQKERDSLKSSLSIKSGENNCMKDEVKELEDKLQAVGNRLKLMMDSPKDDDKIYELQLQLSELAAFTTANNVETMLIESHAAQEMDLMGGDFGDGTALNSSPTRKTRTPIFEHDRMEEKSNVLNTSDRSRITTSSDYDRTSENATILDNMALASESMNRSSLVHSQSVEHIGPMDEKDDVYFLNYAEKITRLKRLIDDKNSEIIRFKSLLKKDEDIITQLKASLDEAQANQINLEAQAHVEKEELLAIIHEREREADVLKRRLTADDSFKGTMMWGFTSFKEIALSALTPEENEIDAGKTSHAKNSEEISPSQEDDDIYSGFNFLNPWSAETEHSTVPKTEGINKYEANNKNNEG